MTNQVCLDCENTIFKDRAGEYKNHYESLAKSRELIRIYNYGRISYKRQFLSEHHLKRKPKLEKL